MTKIIIGGQEFALNTCCASSFLKIYGVATDLVKLLSNRLELFQNETIGLSRADALVNILAEFIPLKLGFRPLYIYNLIYLEYANSYRTYRHIFNLPVNGQRTWGGGRSIRILQSQLRDYKIKKLSKNLGMPATYFIPEMVNLL